MVYVFIANRNNDDIAQPQSISRRDVSPATKRGSGVGQREGWSGVNGPALFQDVSYTYFGLVQILYRV